MKFIFPGLNSSRSLKPLAVFNEWRPVATITEFQSLFYSSSLLFEDSPDVRWKNALKKRKIISSAELILPRRYRSGRFKLFIGSASWGLRRPSSFLIGFIPFRWRCFLNISARYLPNTAATTCPISGPLSPPPLRPPFYPSPPTPQTQIIETGSTPAVAVLPQPTSY